jgi:hypothetical protein
MGCNVFMCRANEHESQLDIGVLGFSGLSMSEYCFCNTEYESGRGGSPEYTLELSHATVSSCRPHTARTFIVTILFSMSLCDNTCAGCVVVTWFVCVVRCLQVNLIHAFRSKSDLYRFLEFQGRAQLSVVLGRLCQLKLRCDTVVNFARNHVTRRNCRPV